jgi:Rieske Fe-S protein
MVAAILLYVTLNASADNFPDGYIQNQISTAKQGITVNFEKIPPGELLTVEYVGRPIFIYRRTPTDIRDIENFNAITLADAENKRLSSSILSEYGSTSSAVWTRLLILGKHIASINQYRSIEKNILVIAGWSSESGCALVWVKPQDRTSKGEIFRDPCTEAQFDAAGRIFNSTLTTLRGKRDAWYNLGVPPYRVEKGGKLIIGPHPGEPIPELNFSRDELYLDKTPTKLLMYAARYNDIETVKAALKAGANVNYFKLGEGSPIDAAVIGSSTEIIQLLVEHGAMRTPNTINAALFLGRYEILQIVK